MRLNEPRVAPLSNDPKAWDAETRELLEPMAAGGRLLNIFRTLANHPKLMRRWLVFGNHVLAKQTLPPREREIVILRMGWLCRSEYEWSQHVVIGKQAGLSDEEIERITRRSRRHPAGAPKATACCSAPPTSSAGRQPSSPTPPGQALSEEPRTASS